MAGRSDTDIGQKTGPLGCGGCGGAGGIIHLGSGKHPAFHVISPDRVLFVVIGGNPV